MFPGVRQCIPDTNFGYGTIASNSTPAKRFHFAVAASLQLTSSTAGMICPCLVAHVQLRLATSYKLQNKIKGFHKSTPSGITTTRQLSDDQHGCSCASQVDKMKHAGMHIPPLDHYESLTPHLAQWH